MADGTALGTFDTATQVQLSATFKSAAGTLTDPTAVVCTVKDPAGAVTTPATTKASTGVYNATLDLTGGVAGMWWFRFSGTGTLVAAEEGWLYVEASQI